MAFVCDSQNIFPSTGRYRWPRGLKPWVCGRSLAGTVGSDPAGGMDVCRL